ncbi:MAG TPA: TlpA family protein disulfide reductase [Polyangiaceae bacterium]
MARRATKNSGAAVLALALATCPFGVVGCGGGQTANEPPPGVSAIADTRTPIQFKYDSLDNRPVDSESTLGAPTVIAFIATWDLLSQAQVDFLVTMNKSDQGRVHYLIVALQEPKDRELVEVYVEHLGVEFPSALADPQTIAGGGPFGDVHNVPSVVVLDAEGKLVWLHPGLARSNDIRSAMHGGSTRAK